MAEDNPKKSVSMKRREALLLQLSKLKSGDHKKVVDALEIYIEGLSDLFEHIETKRKAVAAKNLDANNALIYALNNGEKGLEIELFEVAMSRRREALAERNSELPKLKFKNISESYTIQTDSNRGYKPNYLLNTLYEQASIDISRLTLAANSADNLSLPQAKLLAEKSFRTSVAGLSVTDIIPYPNEKFVIRILPYCNIALMGVPYAVYLDGDRVPPEFMAIPHEIGHLVFRQIYREDKTVKQYLMEKIHPRIPKWAMNWLEEMFADAYGCSVAGEASIWGFQSMLASSPLKRIYLSSNTHPLPAIRPLIQYRMLQGLGNSGESEIGVQDLNEAWRQTAQDLWGINDLENHFFIVDGQPIRGIRIIEVLQPMISEICSLLTSSNTLDAPMAVPDLSTHGEPELILSDSLNQEPSPTKMDQVRSSGDDEHKFKKELDLLVDEETKSIPIDDLAEVALFSGWSDEGTKASMGSGGG